MDAWLDELESELQGGSRTQEAHASQRHPFATTPPAASTSQRHFHRQPQPYSRPQCSDDSNGEHFSPVGSPPSSWAPSLAPVAAAVSQPWTRAAPEARRPSSTPSASVAAATATETEVATPAASGQGSTPCMPAVGAAGTECGAPAAAAPRFKRPRLRQRSSNVCAPLLPNCVCVSRPSCWSS